MNLPYEKHNNTLLVPAFIFPLTYIPKPPPTRPVSFAVLGRSFGALLISLCMDNIIIQETGLFYYPWFYHYVILTTWPTCCVYGLANRKTQKQQGWLGSLRHDMVQRQGCLQWFLRVRRLKFISLLNEMFGNFRFPAISVWQHAWRFKIFISLNQSVHQINQIPDKLLLLRGCPTNWTSREATNPFCPLWCK